MHLPFTRNQFLDVFALYNESFWPFIIALWVVTTAIVMVFLQGTRKISGFICLLLAVHWAWAGLAYHAAFFSSINPAAWLFSGLFEVQAGLLTWYGVRRKIQFSGSRFRSIRHVASWILLVYALAYPALALAEGDSFPRLPTFGVPCPSTILTIGFLLIADRPLKPTIALIPILWGFIAGSAAFVLGMHVDLMLLAAAIGLLVYIITDNVFFRDSTDKSTQKASVNGH